MLRAAKLLLSCLAITTAVFASNFQASWVRTFSSPGSGPGDSSLVWPVSACEIAASNGNAVLGEWTCTPAPWALRRWILTNKNDSPINALWRVVGTRAWDSTVAYPGDNTFTSPLACGSNTIIITWHDSTGALKRDSALASTEGCVVESLMVIALCSDDPDTARWQISNPNPFAVDISWESKSICERGKLSANDGLTYLATPACGRDARISIAWRNPAGKLYSAAAVSSSAVCDVKPVTIAATSRARNKATWQVCNPNLFPLRVDWSLCGTNISGAWNLRPGCCTMDSPAPDSASKIVLVWLDADGAPCKASADFAPEKPRCLPHRPNWNLKKDVHCEAEHDWNK